MIHHQHVGHRPRPEAIFNQGVVHHFAGLVCIEPGRRVDEELVHLQRPEQRGLLLRGFAFVIVGHDQLAVGELDGDARAQALHAQRAVQQGHVMPRRIIGGGMDQRGAEPGFRLDALELAHALEDRLLAGQLEPLPRVGKAGADDRIQDPAGARLAGDKQVEPPDRIPGLADESPVNILAGCGPPNASQGRGARNHMCHLQGIAAGRGLEDPAGDVAVQAPVQNPLHRTRARIARRESRCNRWKSLGLIDLRDGADARGVGCAPRRSSARIPDLVIGNVSTCQPEPDWVRWQRLGALLGNR